MVLGIFSLLIGHLYIFCGEMSIHILCLFFLLIVFLLLNFRNPLYILDIKALPYIWFANTFRYMDLFLDCQLYSVSLCLTLCKVPHCFDSCSFVVIFEIRKCESPALFFLKTALATQGPLHCHMNLRIGFSIFTEKGCWNFIVSVYCFGNIHIGILTILSFPTYEHGVLSHLFRCSLVFHLLS